MSAFVSLDPPRFGRLNYYVVVAVHSICGYGMIVGGHWAAYTFCGAVLAALWIGGYIDWRRSLKIDHDRHDGHTRKVCDLCDPVCYAHDNSPLSYADWRDHFYIGLQGLPRTEWADMYEAYLQHPKFRNYPRP